MKAFRIQVRYKGYYTDGIVLGINFHEAGLIYSEKVKSGEITAKPNSNYLENRLFLTYEEVNRDATISVNTSKENKLGIQVEPTLFRER